MVRSCIICGKELTGKQRTLCADRECHKERKKEIASKYRRNHSEEIKRRGCEYYRNNKIERQKYKRKYYQNNTERIRERSHRYYQNNIEKIRKYNRVYCLDNRERIQVQRAEWRQNNSEKVKKCKQDYYQNNLEKIKEDRYNYRQNNIERIRAYDSRRYRLSRDLPEDADLHKETSIEIIMREWLQENDIEFIEQYYINLENSTWTFVDFYIPELNICLYCDGDYYHLLPNAKKCDGNQNRILPQMGYNVVRMTEVKILEGDRPWCIIQMFEDGEITKRSVPLIENFILGQD